MRAVLTAPAPRTVDAPRLREASPAPEEERDQREHDGHRDAHVEGAQQHDAVQHLCGDHRGRDGEHGEQAGERPDPRRGRYCLTYGRPAAAGPIERPTTPATAISVSA